MNFYSFLKKNQETERLAIQKTMVQTKSCHERVIWRLVNQLNGEESAKRIWKKKLIYKVMGIGEKKVETRIGKSSFHSSTSSVGRQMKKKDSDASESGRSGSWIARTVTGAGSTDRKSVV